MVVRPGGLDWNSFLLSYLKNKQMKKKIIAINVKDGSKYVRVEKTTFGRLYKVSTNKDSPGKYNLVDIKNIKIIKN